MQFDVQRGSHLLFAVAIFCLLISLILYFLHFPHHQQADSFFVVVAFVLNLIKFNLKQYKMGLLKIVF